MMISLLTGILHAERPVRILYFHAPVNAPKKASVYGAGKMLAETELPRDNFSESFEIPDGNLNLSFLPSALEEGAKPPKNAPSVAISENWSKVLLLVQEDKSNAAMPIKLMAIDASDNVFGPGSIYMMNLSTIRIGGTLGNKELDLKPRSVQIVKSPSAKDGYYPAILYAQIKKGEKPQRFIKQMWGHDDNIRKVLFVLPKPPPHYATYYSAPIRDF
ncbi:hypothetical protein ACFQY0_16090 [Haloferula chungangensis]|uniref:Uncharacterized protein n=1 Tax=Haloferula chungangensis TaxID=1048331 RepID=A0ABW2L8J4_9BACT